MRNKNFWINLTLANLCIVALFGLTLRTKFLFPIKFIDYKNFLSAHSHFAFGGWVTLALAILLITQLLTPAQQQKKIYQGLLTAIVINAFGMLVSFPFKGYALFSIIFSTLFIFSTYAFSWVFINDLRKTNAALPVKILAVSALICLVISSVGPFMLAYILATHKGDMILFRNSIYTYLHFQYNGFFTLSVFALFINQFIHIIGAGIKKRIMLFSVLLSVSVLPALSLSMLSRHFNIYLYSFGIAGCIMTFLTLLMFFSFAFRKEIYTTVSAIPLAKTLLFFSLASFVIKMILQTGTIFPALRDLVFGYRPIIIGFLHLVFLAFVSFYILSNYLVSGFFLNNRFSKGAIIFFAAAVFFNEGVLLADGIGLLFRITHPAYPWLLWIAAILLFVGAFVMWMAKLRSRVKDY